MNSLTRYDPLTRGFDDVFKGMFLRPARFDLAALPALQVKRDITENGDRYQVSAEMPGVKQEDIKLSVEGNIVRISAETKVAAKYADGVLKLKLPTKAASASHRITLS